MASRSWNKVELIGNLTRDPELRYTPSGSAVCTFGLATNRYYTTADGEKKEEADFHRLVTWNKLAEICKQFLKKGTKIFVSGRLQYREWETQDGQKRRDAEITLDDMIILTPKGGEGTVAEEMRPVSAATEGPKEEKASQAEETSKKEEDSKVEKPEKSEKTESNSAAEETPPKAPQEEVADDLPF